MTEGEAAAAEPGSAAERRDRLSLVGNRILNWVLVRERLATANAEASARFTTRQRLQLSWATRTLGLGQLVRNPGDAVEVGSTAPHAANLFRQSIHWALLALLPDDQQLGPSEAWAASDFAILVAAFAHERVQVEGAMHTTFVELEEATAESQRNTAALLRRAAKSLLVVAKRPLRRVEWLKLVRAVRLFGVLLVCSIPLVIGMRSTQKPNLARGKAWRVSSVALECHPEKSECGGVSTDILFNTRQESDPWFEYDLGSVQSFSSLLVRNRSDAAPEKAIPLVAEVSDDDQHFRQVARRDEPFWIWKPSFPTQHARYVRLRVARESMLHLEAIKVYP